MGHARGRKKHDTPLGKDLACALADLRRDSGVPMKLVYVISPYAGDVERNLRYLRACLADCFRRGEAPFASHALYTQPGVLRDEVPEERALGMEAGRAWMEWADVVAVYTDLGESRGMRGDVAEANLQDECVFEGRASRIEYRDLGGEWSDVADVRAPSGEADTREASNSGVSEERGALIARVDANRGDDAENGGSGAGG